MAEEEVPFFKLMRQRTRNIHDVSDALVNLKLGLTLSDDTVWSEGILTFANIFLFLESALSRHQMTQFGGLDVKGLRRTEGLQKDLEAFYGKEWEEKLNSMKNTPAVQNYIAHLEQVEEEDPNILCAYVYHLYMGLLSGGQILSAKKKISRKQVCEGEELFKIEKPLSVYLLKKSIRDAMQSISEQLSGDAKERILQESVKVFELNNTLIHSVKGVNEAFSKLVQKVIIVSVFILLISYIIAQYYVS